MSQIENILAGVVAGLIVAIILYFAGLIANRKVIPWIRSKKYRGFWLQGTWHCHYKTSEASAGPDQEITVSQSGTRIKGELVIHRWVDGSTANIKMPVYGEVIGDKVFLISERQTIKHQLFGASIYQVLDQGARLEGDGLSVQPVDNKICTFKRKWSRVS